MSTYRKVYESHHGSIPKDDLGRSYEIHHIDGNRSNNNINNLIALSVQEHYDLHLSQGDYGACLRIASKLKKSKEELSFLAKKAVSEQTKNGKNKLIGGDIQRKTQKKLFKEGKHNFVVNRKSKLWFSENAKKVMKDLFVRGIVPQRTQLQRGNHPSQQTRTCPHCGKTGNGGGMLRWHFDSCKIK